MRTLTLPLRAEYFDAIVAGKKCEEYRLRTPFWQKRLEGRKYDQIVLTKGYPKRSDAARRHVIPWQGMVVKTLKHPFFGDQAVEVYAIRVTSETVAQHAAEDHENGCAISVR
ncbi:MAG: ASCH domain-containing protein [Pseudomonadota bacterium]